MSINRQKIVSLTPTIGVDAYTANDVVGGLLTFDVSNAGAGGVVRWVRIVDDDAEDAQLNLYLFSDTPTSIADDAAFAPTVADLKKLVGKVEFAAADYETTGGNSFVIKRGGLNTADVDFYTTTGDIFGYLVAVGTPTYTAATDLTITIGVWLDG